MLKMKILNLLGYGVMYIGSYRRLGAACCLHLQDLCDQRTGHIKPEEGDNKLSETSTTI